VANKRDKWAQEQTDHLIEMGDDPQDAEETVRDALLMIPEGEEPADYLPPDWVVEGRAYVSEVDVAGARVDWYASDVVGAKWKRLLDAKESRGGAR